MEKKKISAFEFAIMEIADPELAKKHRPETREEETDRRKEKLKAMAQRLMVKKCPVAE